ncbi:signal peptidase I [Microbacterium sp. SORGH_AS_0888]|uniref:signal peptidase I n=1 Tax=Microbacterium sp. SORGH_AS_0888 TaxID=3041791 RepID=UPI0027840AA9|nr:signal peptidase I [Microbacterium sp. SORGH_AS_0888]MDQ1130930.1 signal peptidase I [Microbacterium sp. SORGH_AS_0888]
MIDDPEKQRRDKFTRRVGEATASTGSLALTLAQWGVVALVILAAIPATFQWFLGYSYETVLTGSMEPTIKVGEVAVMRTPVGGELRPGVVVGFKDTSDTKFTHRVQAVGDDGRAVTKGDANDAPDLFQPSEDDLWGVLVHVIPQPLAGFITVMSLNPEWWANATGAVVGGQWDALAALLPTTPWGPVALVVAALLVWWVIPEVIEARQEHKARRAESEEEQAGSEPQNDIEPVADLTATGPSNNQEKQQ